MTAALFLLLPLLGDIVLPDEHPVTHSFLLEGMSRFPDLIFVAYPTDMSGGYERIEEGKPFGFYKFAHPRIWALRAGTDLDSRWMDDAATPRSEVTLDRTASLPDHLATEKILTRYHVAAIEGARIRLETEGSDHFDYRGERVRPGTRNHRKQTIALVVTLLVEALVVCLILRRAFPAILPVSLGANLISHPILWYLFTRVPSLLLLESGVVLLEAILFKTIARQTWKMSLIASLAANALSFAVGLALVQ